MRSLRKKTAHFAANYHLCEWSQAVGSNFRAVGCECGKAIPGSPTRFLVWTIHAMRVDDSDSVRYVVNICSRSERTKTGTATHCFPKSMGQARPLEKPPST